MTATMMSIPERRLTYGVILALAIQLGAAFMWAGSATARLSMLEQDAPVSRANDVRLARLEARLESIDAQLDRIESRLQDRP